MKRFGLGVLAGLLLLGGTAHAEEADAKTASERPLFGVEAIATRGTFATLSVSRAGVLGSLRPRALPIAVSLMFEGGKTDHGLGTHRAEVGFDLRTPWPVFAVSAGVHLSYAILVRTTGNDNFMRAVWGDIGSFGLGGHVGFEGLVKLGPSTSLALGARGALETYDGAMGWMVGPMAGVVF